MLLLKIAYLIEGWLIPENAGPMFFYYNAVSAGKIIPKYKIRLIKMKYIDPEGAKRHDWIAYSAEWTPDSRTYVGQFVKKFYLDLISHNVQPTLSTSEKVKDVHLPLDTAPVIARSAATRQSSAFDFVAAFLDCRASCLASLAAKGFFAMTAHLFAQLNLVANQVSG